MGVQLTQNEFQELELIKIKKSPFQRGRHGAIHPNMLEKQTNMFTSFVSEITDAFLYNGISKLS